MNIQPIGGQALPNGVMIHGPYKTSIVLRDVSGKLLVSTWSNKHIKIPNKVLLRGIFQIFFSFAASFNAMRRAIQLSRSKGIRKMSLRSLLNVGIVLCLFVLYAIASDSLYSLPNYFSNDNVLYIIISILIGIADVVMLFALLFAISRFPAVNKILKYHGAEHKAINCYENGKNMTIDNVTKQSRFHKRCGTSMVVTFALVGVIVMALIPPALSYILQVLIILVSLLISIGIVYESMRSKKENCLTRLGMAGQRITTLEPDDGMVECAIKAIQKAIDINQ